MKHFLRTATIGAIFFTTCLACTEESVRPSDDSIQISDQQLPTIDQNACACTEDFESLPDTGYSHGTTIPSACLEDIMPEPFYLSTGGLASGSVAIRQAPANHMNGQALYINEVNLNANLKCLVDGLCINVVHQSGNLNLRVNGAFANFTSFSQLDGTMFNDVVFNVLYGVNGNPVTLCFDGIINDFAIGGQDLILDDLCLGQCVGEIEDPVEDEPAL